MALARTSEEPRSLSFTANPPLGTVTGFSPSTYVVLCHNYSTNALYPLTDIALLLQFEAVASLIEYAYKNVQSDRPTNICCCHTRSVPAASRAGPPPSSVSAVQ
jgi:hypothetical protein